MVASDIVRLLKTSDKIALISHIMPDGDTLGSSLALALTLRQKGKEVVCLCSDPIPKSYAFLPGADVIRRPIHSDADITTVLAIDCSDRERLGDCNNIFSKANYTVNIDHHISNTSYAHYNMVDTTAAATAELIYQLIRLTGANIEKQVATCLYTGIVTDTGRFSYDNTTSVTHEIAGDLINCGVDTNWLNDELFNKRSLQRTRLLAKALDTIQVCGGGSIAFIKVDMVMLRDVGADDADCDGLVNYARDIDTAEVGLLFKEMDNGRIKVSLRSKNHVDVNAIAAKFNGGGHKKASGCTISASMDEAVEMVLKELEPIMKVAEV